MERLKTQSVANDTRQVERLEYNETFTLVVKAISVHLVLTMAISRNWSLTQIHN